MSCKGCVFRETYHDMSWSCSVCTLHADLYQAIKACENSESCPYRFTVEEAKKIVFEKAGHLPVNYKQNDEPCVAPEQDDPPRTIMENLALQGQISDAFQEVAKAVFDAVHSLLQSMGETK